MVPKSLLKKTNECQGCKKSYIQKYLQVKASVAPTVATFVTTRDAIITNPKPAISIATALEEHRTTSATKSWVVVPSTCTSVTGKTTGKTSDSTKNTKNWMSMIQKVKVSQNQWVLHPLLNQFSDSQNWLDKWYSSELHFTEKEDTSAINQQCEFRSEVTIVTTIGATILAWICNTTCNALMDTGATKSCTSESCYHTFMLTNLKYSPNILVRSALWGNLYPVDVVTCTFHLGKQTITYSFIVCKNLARPFKFGLHFLHKHKSGAQQSDTGETRLTHDKYILVGLTEVT